MTHDRPRTARVLTPGPLVACLLFTCLTAACTDGPPKPRTLPFPDVDPARAFPELAATADAASSRTDGAGGSDFERTIARALDGEPDATEPATVSLQAVPLGAGLVGQLPLRFDEWQWASDGTVTLVTHALPGAAPDALIYIERFGPTMRAFPSVEITRFLSNVDPATPAGPNLLGTLASSFESHAAAADMPAMQLLHTLEAATSPTMGLGLGYESDPRTFTGWRWVGHNRHDTALRIARTHGRWGPQRPPGAHIGLALDRLGTQIPELQQLGELVEQARQPAPTSPNTPLVPTRPAYMLVAHAALPGPALASESSGVHLAILCEQTPRCPVARELADFLASLRPGDHGEADSLRRGQSTDDLLGFAEAAGLRLVPPDAVIAPAELESLLQGLSF